MTDGDPNEELRAGNQEIKQTCGTGGLKISMWLRRVGWRSLVPTGVWPQQAQCYDSFVPATESEHSLAPSSPEGSAHMATTTGARMPTQWQTQLKGARQAEVRALRASAETGLQEQHFLSNLAGEILNCQKQGMFQALTAPAAKFLRK